VKSLKTDKAIADDYIQITSRWANAVTPRTKNRLLLKRIIHLAEVDGRGDGMKVAFEPYLASSDPSTLFAAYTVCYKWFPETVWSGWKDLALRTYGPLGLTILSELQPFALKGITPFSFNELHSEIVEVSKRRNSEFAAE
jgi:hypothetical protein